MKKGHSLEKDLRLLVNNSKYSDIEILCENEVKLYGCRAILAARSEVFEKLLYNGMRESYEGQVSFPKVNSSGMEIILEFIYTGIIQEESLTEDNIIEAFNAADYFELPDLRDHIIETVKNTLRKNYTENYSPELLSKIIETESTEAEDDKILLNLLVEAVAIIPLNTIKFGRLSILALQYLLAYTHDALDENKKQFVTPEYEVFRYSAILAANQVSNDAYKTLMEQLPTLEQIDDSMETELIINDQDNQEIAKELDHLIKYIDFKRIKGHILTDIIEPLEIVPPKVLNSVYRYKTKYSNVNLSDIRGIAPSLYVSNEFDCFWDESAHGSKLVIKDDGKVVEALDNCSSHQNVRAKIKCDKGVYEWDVIIEKYCSYVWVGVCASENFDLETFAGPQSTAWLLGSSGDCRNGDKKFSYCPAFIGDYQKVTVHLNMTKGTIAFSVNDTKYPEVSSWDLSSKIYPVVSICSPGRIRIQPHQKVQKV